MVKVLIVDDNDNNRLTLNLLLEEIEAVEVSEAENGQIAVEMCVSNSFDIVFMDIMMPVMDGFEATKFIKQLNKNTMIIVLSALDDDHSKNKMLSLGAEDYLTKPIRSDLFFARMKHYLKIVAMRKKSLEAKSLAQNPFDSKIFSRTIVFKVFSDEGLSEFWDYWLKGEKEIVNLSDCVRIIYGLGLWLLKNEYTFTIEIEESEKQFFFLLKFDGAIRSSVIRNILTKHYPSARYILSPSMLSFQLDKESGPVVRELDDKTKEMLSVSHINNYISAVDYVQNTALSFMTKIDNLEVLDEDADVAIIAFEGNPTQFTLNVVCEHFREYANLLEQLMDFSHLGYAIETLLNFLSSLTEEQLEEEKVHKLASMLLNLLHDLGQWRENVFITQVARDIHYLDASLLSSCLQIEMIFEDPNTTVSDNDIEFF